MEEYFLLYLLELQRRKIASVSQTIGLSWPLQFIPEYKIRRYPKGFPNLSIKWNQPSVIDTPLF